MGMAVLMNFSSEMKKRVTEIKSIIERNLPEEEGFQRPDGERLLASRAR